MINLANLSAHALAHLDTAISSIETELKDLQKCGLVDGSGIELIELSEAVAAEIEFRGCWNRQGRADTPDMAEQGR